MNNIQKIFKEVVVLALVIISQWLLVPVLAFNGARPDILLLYIIFKSLDLEKPGAAIILGFTAGLVFNWLSGSPVGLSSLILTIAAFTAALVGRENEKLTKTYLFIIGFLLISTSAFLYFSILLNGLGFKEIFTKHILPAIIYNLLLYLSIIFLFPFKKKRKQI